MIKLPVQKLPKLQDRPFFFRTMENDRYQSQIQQTAQNPGQPPVLFLCTSIFK
jgi:hypothetical protein